MDLHATTGATVGEIASIAGCTLNTLRKRFAKIYGIDVAAQLRDSRGSHVLAQLVNTDLPIAEISQNCGFTSPSNFFNFVKRYTGGIGPLEYRSMRQHAPPDSGGR